jgi:hypothetical protein
MIDGAMNTITLELVGEHVMLTLSREVGQLIKVRRIAKPKAFAMSLLLLSDPHDEALNYEVDAGISLQIENVPYDRAWLMIDDRRGGTKLAACLEGDLIRDVGQSLLQISLAQINFSSALMKCRTFRVGHCYLEER